MFDHFTRRAPPFPTSLIRVCSENDSFGLVSQIAPSLPPSLGSIAFKDIGRQPITPMHQSVKLPSTSPRPTATDRATDRGGVGKRILNFVRDQSEIGPVARARSPRPSQGRRSTENAISIPSSFSYSGIHLRIQFIFIGFGA